jgi:hypothetical protein
MMNRRTISILSLSIAFTVALVACGGHGPLGPSNAEGIVLRGSVLGMSGNATAPHIFSAAFSARSAGATTTVTVREDPTITTTVGSDGSFILRGLPEGGFTLVFTQDGISRGVLTFTRVLPNQEITITVDVASGVVVLVDEKRNGIGHGDVEIEGLVQEVNAPRPGESGRFLIQGRTVVTRPGQTTIREGNQARTVADVKLGRRVHVKGEFLPLEGSVQPVLAQEIILQNDEEAAAPSRSCSINGGRVGDGIQLEGTVASGGASSFMLNVQGNRASSPVRVDASGAAFQCSPSSGPNAPTPDQCRAGVKSGARVHVSGTLQTCDAANALVKAQKVMVQK